MKLATLCYLKRDGQTLMIHRIKKANDMHQGKWNGLGGKLEPGESPEECARREIYEEAGLVAQQLELKGILTFPAFSNNEDWYALVYVGREIQGSLIDSSEGALSWVDDDRLLELNLWEGDHYFLPWLNRPGFFSAKFIYDQGKLTDYQVSFY